MSNTDASPKGLLILFVIFALLLTIVALNTDALFTSLGTMPR
jgi:hypothetical protein